MGELFPASGLHPPGVVVGLTSCLQARGVWVELLIAGSFRRSVVCDDLSTFRGVLAVAVCVALSLLTALLGGGVCEDRSLALPLGVCVEQLTVFGLSGMSSTILLAEAVCVD